MGISKLGAIGRAAYYGKHAEHANAWDDVAKAIKAELVARLTAHATGDRQVIVETTIDDDERDVAIRECIAIVEVAAER